MKDPKAAVKGVCNFLGCVLLIVLGFIATVSLVALVSAGY